ncbi:hypothetical protein NC652_023910 [Populus alba x Populus x berolinensis]|nr:hypothetical protein NC652_023910 [Populus alba x Populus x berolinensis]
MRNGCLYFFLKERFTHHLADGFKLSKDKLDSVFEFLFLIYPQIPLDSWRPNRDTHLGPSLASLTINSSKQAAEHWYIYGHASNNTMILVLEGKEPLINGVYYLSPEIARCYTLNLSSSNGLIGSNPPSVLDFHSFQGLKLKPLNRNLKS